MDDGLFNVLYGQHREFIWNLTSKYFQDSFEREDVFQEVFVRVYRYYKKESFDSEAELKSWLYKVTMSTSINYFKRAKRMAFIKDILVFNHVLWGESKIEEPDSDQDKAVNRILSPLNAKQRAVVLLKEIEDLPYERIAEILNMKLGTVKSTLNRAKEKMKTFLQKGAEVE